MKKLLAACVIGLCLWQPVMAEDLTDAKKATIKELMDLTGAAKMGETMSQSFVSVFLESMKKAQPNLSDKLAKIIEEEVNGVIKEQLTAKEGFYEKLYPLYNKYYTQDDLNQIIAFYKSPVGQKVITTMPDLMKESMQVGQDWGRSLGPAIKERLEKRLKAEGIK